MSLLVFITNTYPFGDGETFVHNEISFMAKAFDQVFILPIYGHEGEKQRRLPSENIKLFPCECKQSENRNPLELLSMRAAWEAFGQLCKPHFRSRLSYIASFENTLRQIVPVCQRIVEEVRRKVPDSICIYSYWSHVHANIALELKKMLKPVRAGYAVSRAHGFDLYEEINSINYIPYRKLIYSELARVFCCSRQGTEYLCQKYPKLKEKFCTSYLGVPDHWSGIMPHRGGTFNIVTCARSVAVKRIDLWIKALSTIQDVPIKWTHLGDGEEQESLKQLAVDILPENIKTDFRGSVDNEEVTRIYNTGNMNLIVNTSSSEGLPVSLMEAFACGIPAVAPNVGGIPEIIDDGVNGFLFPLDASPEIIADKIRCFIQMDDVVYLSFCGKAREKYEVSFHDESNYQDFFSEIKKGMND